MPLRFNEAAADCRGKPQYPARAPDGHGEASMRPRLIAAENLLEKLVKTEKESRLQ